MAVKNGELLLLNGCMGVGAGVSEIVLKARSDALPAAQRKRSLAVGGCRRVLGFGTAVWIWRKWRAKRGPLESVSRVLDCSVPSTGHYAGRPLEPCLFV